MHNYQSDVDIAVYGSENFKKVKEAFHNLATRGEVSILEADKFDPIRQNRGIYKGSRFVINAIRKIEEITEKFGQYRYKAVKPIEAVCRVVNNNESMFRPSVYEVNNCKSKQIKKGEEPKRVVSMIGQFRDFASIGEEIKVKGMLEKEEDLTSGKEEHRIVVGSGKGEEYLWPMNKLPPQDFFKGQPI
jgi:predicted nucleotidyltransferase